MRVSSYALSGATVFLGAYLLFAIQPIVGKQLLPYFGGSSSVWAMSLLFFTSVLSLGYLYVYAITKLSSRTQLLVHAGLIAIAAIFVLISLAYSSGPALSGWESGAPALNVLIALLISIGVPYFLLSTTAPLIQYWYGASGKEPYSLYSLSNAAALLALLSYPFVVEPLIQLRNQRMIWALLFIMYALVGVASALAYTRAHKSSKETHEERTTSLRFREAIVWTLFAALPSFILIATTTEITQTIAPAPLLWVIPLALYLVSFVIAFRGWGQSIFTPLFFLVSALVAWWFTPASYGDITLQILSYLALLFFCGLSCHVLLYRTRPDSESLPLFYVFLSLGGALGVLAASIAAPLVFSDYWEFPLAIALSGALAAWILPVSFFPRILDARRIVIAKLLFILLAASFFFRLILPDESAPTIETRNFYGNAQVIFETNIISLMHGTTLHGTQFAKAADSRIPTTYYTPGGGAGRAILYAKEVRGEASFSVGVIGLGTGTIAAYCAPGDTYVFYEIDPRIETIARSYFSYLSRCDGAEVRVGDGRIVLERERASGESGDYDVLVVDAFSDDTIPVHLLTIEAFRIYISHLRSSESLLAMHISNRYLNLAPVIFRTAAELGFNAMLVNDTGAYGEGGTPSVWVVLSREAEAFQSVVFANANSYPQEPAARVWTDDYSSLIPVLAIPTPWE